MLALVLANGNWAYCGTGHDHLRVMGLELIISLKTIGCAVTLDALEPRMFRIFHCNVGGSGNLLRCDVYSRGQEN